MFVEFNANPNKRRVGDCTVRAISKIIEKTWEDVFIDLCIFGLCEYDMPTSNSVWAKYLYSQGYKKYPLDRDMTVEEFCEENPNGKYILGTGTHAIAVENGDFFDVWDSGNEIPIYYFQKER